MVRVTSDVTCNSRTDCSTHIHIMILPPDKPCQSCAWISHRSAKWGEVPIPTSKMNMKQHLHQTSRHRNMILLKSCMVLMRPFLLSYFHCWRQAEEELYHSDANVLPTSLFIDDVPIATEASQLMVSFPMTPVLMDTNAWLRGNG